jgi:hypothetical protein
MNRITDYFRRFLGKPLVQPEEKPEQEATAPTVVVVPPVKFYTRESLAERLQEVREMGWIENTQPQNDGAAGNILEHLLGIPTNNVPIPDASGWELKTQKTNTQSLISLSHKEPEPRRERVVSKFLLPNYGWPHQEAGKTYPEDEMSFRMTMNGKTYTDRGFKVIVNREKQRLEVEFNSEKVDARHAEWLKSVEEKEGLGPLRITPYWNFNDIYISIGRKFFNTFLVRVDVKKENNKEYFHYVEAYALVNVDIDKFLEGIEDGKIKVEFDARTHHNHGTKMRMYFRDVNCIYKEVIQMM